MVDPNAERVLVEDEWVQLPEVWDEDEYYCENCEESCEPLTLHHDDPFSCANFRFVSSCCESYMFTIEEN